MPEYRRRLPHFQPSDAYLFLTWRLFGSLPAQREPIHYQTPGHAFVARDRALEQNSTGPVWLGEHRIAEPVAAGIQSGCDQRRFYDLLAWVIMPNHVHMLILPLIAVPKIMRWLKGSTARSANLILSRTGERFWQDETYDHYVRSAQERDRIIDYIESNSVTAGLVTKAESWPWSSAGQNRLPHQTGA